MIQHEQLFTQVILIFHQSAMLGMGKIKNPVTQQIERNMVQAKQAIDIIEVLKEKTKGNLSPNEEKLMETVMTELRLNYVEESSGKS